MAEPDPQGCMSDPSPAYGDPGGQNSNANAMGDEAYDPYEQEGERSARAAGVADEQDNIAPLQVPFVDRLKHCLPETSMLMTWMEQRMTRAWVVHDDVAKTPQMLSMDQVLMLREARNPQINTAALNNNNTGLVIPDNSALVIHDINLDWCQALYRAYPDSVQYEFLEQHAVRFETVPLEIDLRRPWKPSERDFAATLTVEKYALKRYLSLGGPGDVQCIGIEPEAPLPDFKGFHLDFQRDLTCTLNAAGKPQWFLRRSKEHRRDVFEECTGGQWTRTSTRVSCCPLDKNFYLLLVDTRPQFWGTGSVHSPTHHFRDLLAISLSDYSPGRTYAPDSSLKLPLDFEAWKSPFDFRESPLMRLFKEHTLDSIFKPKCVPIKKQYPIYGPGFIPIQRSDKPADGPVLVWLLAATLWHHAAKKLESRFTALRHEATGLAADKAFPLLIRFRRQLADAQWALAEARERIVDDMTATEKWEVGTEQQTADQIWNPPQTVNLANTGTTAPPAPAIFSFRQSRQSKEMREVPPWLMNTEDVISAIARATNEEIQMVIGAVQIEDARDMKRQTEWTVVLAVLAAIFLPMSLVTGIFGMNITEISLEETGPDRWSVVKAWGWVFGATLIGIVVYAILRSITKLHVVRQKVQKWRVLKWLLRLRVKLREGDVEAQKMD